MKTEKIQLTEEFQIPAIELYDAWLNSKKHEAFTGGGAASFKNSTNSKFSAWDGYIEGEILELEKGKRILHSWRTTEFPESAENSLLELVLEDNKPGCKLTINHWNIPEGQGNEYKQGWIDFYFKPMKKYFNKNHVK